MRCEEQELYLVQDTSPNVGSPEGCIDKTSSAELTEAINSMFEWYRLSAQCYVFLPDVDGTWIPRNDALIDSSISVFQAEATGGSNTFLRSRWFTRGWTLQELLAPRDVEFFNKSFESIGTKHSLTKLISMATGIDRDYLVRKKPIPMASIATRMYWASKRTTQRVEDVAYW